MRAATDDLHTLRARDIVTLTEYERKLNDYLNALVPMNWAIERLMANRSLRLKEDDKDDVEDISIDLEQVIARCKSLLRTITNVRDSYRAVMDTRLNETIRLLTVITVALTIPTDDRWALWYECACARGGRPDDVLEDYHRECDSRHGNRVLFLAPAVGAIAPHLP